MVFLRIVIVVVITVVRVRCAVVRTYHCIQWLSKYTVLFIVVEMSVYMPCCVIVFCDRSKYIVIYLSLKRVCRQDLCAGVSVRGSLVGLSQCVCACVHGCTQGVYVCVRMYVCFFRLKWSTCTWRETLAAGWVTCHWVPGSLRPGFMESQVHCVPGSLRPRFCVCNFYATFCATFMQPFLQLFATFYATRVAIFCQKKLPLFAT